MGKYIDKDALVAEIDRKRDGIKKGIFSIPLTGSDRAFATFEYEIYGKIKDFLDTFEAKEVDINKEISQFIDANFEKSGIGHKLSLRRTAKHFFDLGLSASNPITAADRGTAEEIIINLKRVENDYQIDLTKEMEWLQGLRRKSAKFLR